VGAGSVGWSAGAAASVAAEPAVDAGSMQRAGRGALRALRTTRSGLSSREAQRRLLIYGPNELTRRGGPRWPRELGRQFTHPLALLLWAAAGLALWSGTVAVAVAIVAIIVLNAIFAFVQEVEAGRAVDALRQYLPEQASVQRDGRLESIAARDLVPGDLLALERGIGSRRTPGSFPVQWRSTSPRSPAIRACAALRRSPRREHAPPAGTRSGVQRIELHGR